MFPCNAQALAEFLWVTTACNGIQWKKWHRKAEFYVIIYEIETLPRDSDGAWIGLQISISYIIARWFNSWPFYPLFGIPIRPWKGHVFTIPKRSQRIARCVQFIRNICNTVDGKTPAPVDMVNVPVFKRFYTSQGVQDFFRQQYISKTNIFQKPPKINGENSPTKKQKLFLAFLFWGLAINLFLCVERFPTCSQLSRGKIKGKMDPKKSWIPLFEPQKKKLTFHEILVVYMKTSFTILYGEGLSFSKRSTVFVYTAV